MSAARPAVWLVVLLLPSCREVVLVQPPPACGAGPVFEQKLPGVVEHHFRPEWWTGRAPDDADRTLLDPGEIAALNARNSHDPALFQDVLGAEIARPARVEAELRERCAWLGERLRDGRLVEASPGSFDDAWARIGRAEADDEVRVVRTEATLWCIPVESGLFAPPVDEDFDRNRCTGLHPAEVVRILRRTRDGWLYAHVGHAVGWLREPSLTPPVSPADARRFRDEGVRLVVLRDRIPVPGGAALRLGTSVPWESEAEGGGHRIVVPSETGLGTVTIPADPGVHVGFLPFTRRNVWRLALGEVGRPYGWGGRAGERDCSRLVMDVLGAFGIRSGRHSAVQSRAGVRTVELEGLPEEAKLQLLRREEERGIVLLYMQGHIMLHLGWDGERPMAVSSLSEYKRPCPGGGEELVRVDRVAVSDLELGRGTERRAFLERLVRLAVFGR